MTPATTHSALKGAYCFRHFGGQNLQKGIDSPKKMEMVQS